ncbi:MAG: hypothetical protein ACM3RP_07145 [Chitinophagales bacterium]
MTVFDSPKPVSDIEGHWTTERLKVALEQILDQSPDLQAELRAELHAAGLPGYVFALEGLDQLAAMPAGDCPPGEEALWFRRLELALAEAKARWDYGHHDRSRADMAQLVRRLRQRFETMQKVMRLRGGASSE